MSEPLARLRRDLDFMPSHLEDRPGLLIRDSFQYSDATLIIPPALVAVLDLFDGTSTTADLREALFRITGDLNTSGLVEHLNGALRDAGFLEDAVYRRLRDERHAEFAAAPVRLPAHAGSAYPEELPELNATFERYFAGSTRAAAGTVTAIAAPHVSPEGGWQSYRDAFQTLPPSLGHRTFVVLGTSHYGAPDCFGLTRKPYQTPLGRTQTDPAALDRLLAAAPDSILLEDYCHAVEHSIEFQVLFLQRLYGPDVRVLPILCGAFVHGLYESGSRRPEDSEPVRRFLESLGELAASRSDLAWVLGVDMAHMGRRYGDQWSAHAGQDQMAAVEARDRGRIQSVVAGDAAAFWDQVRENQDDLKWCGSSPIYTFSYISPHMRGMLHRYEQWNIDPQSVVSFGAISFC